MSDVQKDIALKVTADTASAQKAFKNAQQELEETRKALVDLALAGKQNSDEFKNLEQRAGAIQDAIGDVNARVTALANDTPKLQLFGEAVRGVAAGFSIAQGAAALFGDENEDLQKAILQVQGSMALLNGVQEIANLLNKDSALRVQANAIAMRLMATSTGQATGALKLMRVALIGLGIGAVVVAIGALVANWDKLTKAVTDFVNASPMLTKVIGFITDGFTRLGRAIGIIPSATEAATKQMIADLENQLKLLEAAGADTYAIEKRLADLRIQLAKETSEGLAEAEMERTVLVAAENKKRADIQAEAAKKQQEAATERMKKMREENATALKDLNQFLLDMEYEMQQSLIRQAQTEEEANVLRMQAEANRRMKEAQAVIDANAITEKNEELFYQTRINTAKAGLQGIADLVSVFAGQGEAEQKRAFEFQKAAGIAQAVIDGFIATQSVFRNTPGGLVIKTIAAASAAAASLARIQAIRRTTFQSASGSAAPQAVRPAGIPTAPQPQAPQVFNPNTQNPNVPPQPSPQGMGQQTVRAYVVDRDIEQAGARRNRLRSFAGI